MHRGFEITLKVTSAALVLIIVECCECVRGRRGVAETTAAFAGKSACVRWLRRIWRKWDKEIWIGRKRCVWVRRIGSIHWKKLETAMRIERLKSEVRE